MFGKQCYLESWVEILFHTSVGVSVDIGLVSKDTFTGTLPRYTMSVSTFSLPGMRVISRLSFVRSDVYAVFLLKDF